MESSRKLRVNLFSDLDKLIGISVLVLMLIGVFGVFSASTRIDEKYDLLFKKHIVFCFLAFIFNMSLSKLSLKILLFLVFSFFLLQYFYLFQLFFFPGN